MLAKHIMGGGTSAGQAGAINGQAGLQVSVSAAGTTITDATDLTGSINILTTVAASTGVQLPSMDVGDEVEILNLGANSCAVYPYTGERINQLSTNSAFTLGTNTAVKIRKFSSTRCMAWLSA